MANEFRHKDVGSALSEAEYDALDAHELESQATGDVVYASSATQLSRLGIGTSGQVLTESSGIPSWATPATVQQANQAALEAETNENTYAPPDLIKHSPGVAKGWALFLNTTIDASYNVASITDSGVGDWDVNWGDDFSGTSYVVISDLDTIGVTATDATISSVVSLAAGSSTVRAFDYNDGTLTDPQKVYAAAFGDQ